MDWSKDKRFYTVSPQLLWRIVSIMTVNVSVRKENSVAFVSYTSLVELDKIACYSFCLEIFYLLYNIPSFLLKLETLSV
jgi:hypothetical protein